jgi:fructose-bisphosphate aldolase class II
MTRATLAQVLGPARGRGHAVAGLVCLGWEDARAYADAASAEGVPVILQVGPSARAHMPLAVWGPMLGALADAATVPVVIHLDHAATVAECAEAIAQGFTSVMFDGSRLPLADNIALTARAVDLAHASGVSCEGEIGFVGYADGAASTETDPAEAAQFAMETGIDAMAVSVGNVHLKQGAGAGLDAARLAAIAALTDVPLVIHGGSGVPVAQRRSLARAGLVSKFNIGTELRQVFGQALRDSLATTPDQFDRIALLGAVEPALVVATRRILRDLAPSGPEG